MTKFALTAGIPFFFLSLSLSLFSLSRSRSLDLDRRKPVLLFKNNVLSFISTLNYKCCKTIQFVCNKPFIEKGTVFTSYYFDTKAYPYFVCLSLDLDLRLRSLERDLVRRRRLGDLHMSIKL